jgi:hypothetical protein
MATKLCDERVRILEIVHKGHLAENIHPAAKAVVDGGILKRE